MDAASSVLTIAELALTLAGFAGVVVVFSQRDGLLTIDRWRFVGVLVLGVGTAVIAFTPSMLQQFGIEDSVNWRSSSAVLAAAVLAFFVFFLRRIPAVAGEQGARPPQAALRIVFSLTLLALATQISNAAGWPMRSGPGLFMLGLLLMLTVAAFGFSFAVLYRPKV